LPTHIKSKPDHFTFNALYIDSLSVSNEEIMMHNILEILKAPKISNGTIADGVSKVLLIANYNGSLKFSIKEAAVGSDDTIYGKLSHISQFESNSNIGWSQSESVSEKASPINDCNGHNIITSAIYTSPNFINIANDKEYIPITIRASDATDESIHEDVEIKVYRVPVILVHGVWTNSDESWEETKFKKTLECDGFKVSTVDYRHHNAKTFDPCADENAGNHGIAALKQKIYKVLEGYHNQSIAVSQVDIVAHSMGGLIARGFTRQPDYREKGNYMKGVIHRLITIGTPHFGADLAGILYKHKDNWYCFDKSNRTLIPWSTLCGSDKMSGESLQLKTIYSDWYFLPIDKGAIEALSPDSTAYSHLDPTKVKSYAIAGSWRPNASKSHYDLERFYKDILGNPHFTIEQGGFHGDNDLQASLTSQLGGLNGILRNITDEDIPKHGAIFSNTIHGRFLNKDKENKDDDQVYAELESPYIQKDVVKLLKSSDDKYADEIGKG
jgi:pimeloyl-ACP methyl ester carboxylesterase